MARRLRKYKVFTAIALAAFASGCASGERGIAEPGVSETASRGSSGDSAVPSTTEPISLAIDPCGLLSADDLADYGKFEAEERQIGSARSCFWQRSSKGHQEVSTFSLNVRDSQSVETVNDVGGGVVEGEVNGRPAAVAEDPQNGSCTIAMKLDDNSRIDVTITTPPNRDEGSCEFGKEVAYLIEPRLPAVP